ncbi:MAG: parallel beta-helix domain-containing protein [Planctomycetota bacterium]
MTLYHSKAAGLFFAFVVALSFGGCSNSEDPASNPVAGEDQPETKPQATVVISPGPDARKQAQEAMILAQPGDVIEFAAGTFEFDGTLSLDGINDITVRGNGIDETILNFESMDAGQGGEGLKVTANDFCIEDLTIENTPGDAIKLQDCDGVTIQRVRAWWSGGPSTDNGAYGLYPVLCANVLIDECLASGASDAGIYVGQSKQVIVRNCHADLNVAGIEIENCIGADVYDNNASQNTAGILVFSLPGLTVKNGSGCRVFNNEINNNNHPNFAKDGAIVSTVPSGTGVMLMANDNVEVFGNSFGENHGAGCLIVSFLVSRREYNDEEYDPYCEAISIHDNDFYSGGTKAEGEFLVAFTEATGQRLPDIVFDGIVDAAKLVDGALPADMGFSIKDNGEASFVNLDLGRMMLGEEPQISMDLGQHSGSLAPISAVSIPGVE